MEETPLAAAVKGSIPADLFPPPAQPTTPPVVPESPVPNATPAPKQIPVWTILFVIVGVAVVGFIVYKVATKSKGGNNE